VATPFGSFEPVIPTHGNQLSTSSVPTLGVAAKSENGWYHPWTYEGPKPKFHVNIKGNPLFQGFTPK